MGVSRKLGVIVALCGSMVFGGLQLPASAASWNEVEFIGSGWGHGVGMSQYGAFALATTGSNYRHILAHYYQGTSVGTVPSSRVIWVNLERDFSSKQLSVFNVGSTQGSPVVISAPTGATVNALPGATIAISSVSDNGCRVAVTNPGQQAVAIQQNTGCSMDFRWYNWSQPGTNPTTKLQIAGCTARGLPCQYGRGTFHLRHGPGGLDLSVELLLNDYVLGVSEMPATWHVEALKAQAVAARSYAEARRAARGNPATNSCDGWCHVRDTTADQAYVGWGHPIGNWVQAANSTASQVVTHPSRTGAITTYYSSSSGGATEHGHLKGFASSPVQWLTSVNDVWAVDGTVSNPNASWTKTVNAQTVAAAAGLDFLWSAKVTQRRAGSNSVAQVQLGGSVNGDPVTVTKTGAWVRQTFGLKSEYFTIKFQPDAPGDEMMLYKTDGTFRYSDVNPNGTLGAPILSGTGYTKGWKSITAIDLDGDGQDEIMFYRDDGLFRYYEINSNGQIGSPILAGDGYTRGWDSISAIDLDGDGQDEIMFYRDDGLFRYYNIHPNGKIGSPILAGEGYTRGWDSITAVDMDGDGQDEMFFYREDGLFRYYNIHPNGLIGSPILAGDGYTKGWSAIRAIDLDSDGHDEMFFYRRDGLYRFYSVRPSGILGSPISAGSNFGTNWDEIEAVNLDGR